MNVHVPVLHANRYEEEKVTKSVEKNVMHLYGCTKQYLTSC